jgi:hypothetical protein
MSFPVKLYFGRLATVTMDLRSHAVILALIFIRTLPPLLGASFRAVKQSHLKKLCANCVPTLQNSTLLPKLIQSNQYHKPK